MLARTTEAGDRRKAAIEQKWREAKEEGGQAKGVGNSRPLALPPEDSDDNFATQMGPGGEVGPQTQ
jgi:hypothetical protein